MGAVELREGLAQAKRLGGTRLRAFPCPTLLPHARGPKRLKSATWYELAADPGTLPQANPAVARPGGDGIVLAELELKRSVLAVQANKPYRTAKLTPLRVG